MRVYLPSGGAEYEFLNLVRTEDLDSIRLIDGTSRAQKWTPFPVILERENEGERMVESDAPTFVISGMLVLRPAAVLAMGPILREHGELLPLDCPDAQLFAFNATQVLDALDEPKSTFMRHPSDSQIFWIQKYVFKPEVIGSRSAFRITTERMSPIFVTQEFVDRWNAAKLRGLDFKLLWEG